MAGTMEGDVQLRTDVLKSENGINVSLCATGTLGNFVLKPVGENHFCFFWRTL
jgi:hypothetical protein